MRSGTKQPSPSRKPGEETLVEEEDKKRFFDELERGMDSTIDNGELNRQLSNTSLSMRYVVKINQELLKTCNHTNYEHGLAFKLQQKRGYMYNVHVHVYLCNRCTCSDRLG